MSRAEKTGIIMSATESNLCSICDTKSELRCGVCGDFYCSQECQSQDWQYGNHRAICRAMPPLLSTSDYIKHLEKQKQAASLMSPQPDLVKSQQSYDSRAPQKAHIAAQPNRNALPASNVIVPLPNMTVPPPNIATLTKQPSPPTNQNYNRQNTNQNENNQQHQQPYNNPFKGPKQPDGNDALKELHPQKNGDVKNGDCIVVITGWRNSQHCLVRYMCDTEAFFELASKVNELGALAPVIKRKPELGNYVLVRDKGMLQRARIVNCYMHDNKYACFLYDSGHLVTRKQSEMFLMSDQISSLPSVAFQLKLKGVEELKLNESLRKMLNIYIGKSFLASITSCEAILTEPKTSINLNKTLIDYFANYNFDFQNKPLTESNGNINNTNGPQNRQRNRRSDHENSSAGRPSESYPSDNLNKSQLPPEQSKMNYKAEIPTEPKQVQPPAKSMDKTEAPILIPPFKIQKLQVNIGEFIGCITDNSNLKTGNFGCLPSGKVHELLETMNFMEEYKSKALDPYTPVLGEYCAAIYSEDGCLYRAKIIEISDSLKYRVRFIDFTNEGWVEANDIRRYPEELKNVCYSTLCTFKGLPDYLTKEQVTFLEGKMEFQHQLKINNVLEYRNEVAVLECHEILQAMLKNGLLD